MGYLWICGLTHCTLRAHLELRYSWYNRPDQQNWKNIQPSSSVTSCLRCAKNIFGSFTLDDEELKCIK